MKKKQTTLPHASSVLKRVGPALERPIEMTVNLMLPLPTLIQQSKLEQRPHVGAVAGKRDENRNVRRRILGVLPVGVEVNRPIVTADVEGVGRNVLPGAHALGQGVAADGEVVGPIHRLVDRPRARVERDVGFAGVHDHLIGVENPRKSRGFWGFDRWNSRLE